MVAQQPSILEVEEQRARVGRFVDAVHLTAHAGGAELRLRLVANPGDGKGSGLEIAYRSGDRGALGLRRFLPRGQNGCKAPRVRRAQGELRAVFAAIPVTDIDLSPNSLEPVAATSAPLTQPAARPPSRISDRTS